MTAGATDNPAATPLPVFSVNAIPFSRFGSWLCITPFVGVDSRAEQLHLVSHQAGMHAVLRFVPTFDGAAVETSIVATPAELRWSSHVGSVSLAFEDIDTVRVRGRGMGLLVLAATPSLTPFSGPYFFRDPVDGAHVVTLYETGRRYRITVLEGKGVDASGAQLLGTGERGLALPSGGDPWEIAIEELTSAGRAHSMATTFDDVIDSAAADFTRFLDDVAPWRSPLTPAADLAAYVIWSAAVRPLGFVTRPAILMSKHWMDKVWSWDHCFNAIALASGRPDLALDQFELAFDHQDEAGCLPDSITHSEVLFNFVKPPIHGWALQQLRSRLPEPIPLGVLRRIYEQLDRWTQHWLTYRRAPGRPLAHYQHGNDSGWDNATTFDHERVVETSDLASFLVLQMRTLADLATELDDDLSARRWTVAAEEMLDATLSELWRDDHFVARSATSNASWTSNSLLDVMAVVLGAELPSHVASEMARRVERHLTEHGLATELPSSAEYVADGYWRGPIWAPSTVLIDDGLRRCGCNELADEISARFRRLCEMSGFAENFDALSGDGLRDRAYTWTASGYLILAGAFERDRAQHGTNGVA